MDYRRAVLPVAYSISSASGNLHGEKECVDGDLILRRHPMAPKRFIQ